MNNRAIFYEETQLNGYKSKREKKFETLEAWCCQKKHDLIIENIATIVIGLSETMFV